LTKKWELPLSNSISIILPFTKACTFRTSRQAVPEMALKRQLLKFFSNVILNVQLLEDLICQGMVQII